MCGLCSMKCKASCIDSKNKIIDNSRCVTCFNCIEVCNRSAMKYTIGKPVNSLIKKEVAFDTKDDFKIVKETNLVSNNQINESKRRFLSASLITGLAAGKLFAQEMCDK